MGTKTTCLALSALLATALISLAGDAATADEGAAPAARLYRVRVVRVQCPDGAGIEAAEPFPDTTIRKSWPEVMAALKKRGRTTIFLDQRLTSMVGHVVKGETARQVPDLRVASAESGSKHDIERKSAARSQHSCSVALTPTGPTLRYEIRCQWTGPERKHGYGPAELRVDWTGMYRQLKSEMLVLSQRQQIDAANGQPASGVEVYCFILGHGASAGK